MQKHKLKRLYRSREDRLLAGVCGGIGEYFKVDPVWIRVLFVALIICAASPLIVYLIMWIIVPSRPRQGQCQHCDDDDVFNR